MKIKIFLISLLFFFCTNLLLAQDPFYDSDSLKTELQYAENDTSKFFLLMEIGYSYRYTNPKEAIKFSLEAIDLASLMNVPTYIGYSYEMLSLVYSVQGRYVEALNCDLKANAIFVKGDEKDQIYNSWNNLGDDYMHLNSYKEAFQYFLQSLELATENNDSSYIAITLFNMGKVYKEQKNYDQAKKYIHNSLTISSNIGDKEGFAFSNFELANIALQQQDYEEAEFLYNKALKYTRNLKLLDLEAKVLVKRGELHDKNEDLFHALEDFFRALGINEKIKNEKGVAEAYLGLARLHLKRNSIESALISLNRGLGIADKLNSRALKADFYKELSAYYEKLNVNDKALDFYKKYKGLEDSVYNNELSQQLALYETQYESDKKDREIELLNKDKELQKSKIESERTKNVYLLSSLAVVLILFVFIYYSYRSKNSANELLLRQKEAMVKQQKQLKQANKVKDKFFSIISHDLKAPFHSLSGVLALVEQGVVNPEEQKMIFSELKNKFEKTNYLLNNLLDWARTQMHDIEVKKETFNVRELINNEIAVINGVQSKNITIYNNVQPDLVGFFDVNMFSTIIRNLINNGIKFTEENGEISVEALVSDGKIQLEIIDTGVGIEPSFLGQIFDNETDHTTYGTNNEKGTGLGLKLCQEFVQINEEKLWVESEVNKGSKFAFTIQNVS